MHIVEHDEMRGGKRIVVVLTQMGHRCGYVGVARDSQLYGMPYDGALEAEISVHGGLTYAGYDDNYPVHNADRDWWFFGFDCAHYNDYRDIVAMKKYGFEDRLGKYYETQGFGSVVRSREYVLEQCYKLAEQLQNA